ncbi:MAG: hypothetical protein R2838_24350 [Caldilineaceae bacterium]
MIMGGAAPSMESYYAMQQGRLTLLEMPNRVLGHREHVAREQVEAVPVAGVPQGQPRHAERPSMRNCRRWKSSTCVRSCARAIAASSAAA